MVEFLHKILPTTGVIIVGQQLEKGFKHFFHNTVDDAWTRIQALDKAGHTVFVAQASFKTPENRRKDNVKLIRSFWMDIDCGEGKPYANQLEGAQALGDFVRNTNLPKPSVVSSGNGLYAHWAIEEDMYPAQWQGLAQILKQLAVSHGFEIDPVRTADSASVLRPIGATHRKDPTNPKTVTLQVEGPAVSFADFAEAVHTAAKKAKVQTTAFAAPEGGLNADLLMGLETGPPTSGRIVAEKCPQVARVRDTKGDVDEPLWYAAIGLLRHCSEGNDLIHEWSAGHPDYSPEETDKKIRQHKVPPTTCAGFYAVSPTGCVGCSHKGHIKTPMVLGRVVERLETKPEELEPPTGFVRSKNGIAVEDEDGVQIIYPYDIYPTLIAYDSSLGYETTTFRHHTPHDGVKDFAIRSALFHDSKALFMALSDNHVQVVGKGEKNMMQSYLESYAAKLRAKTKVAMLYNQMGWRQDKAGEPLSFILGSKLFQQGNAPVDIGLAQSVPDAAGAYGEHGDAAEWVETTKHFNNEDTINHFFAFCAGAFGAPLLRFTGFAGALVSCVGDSGSGKTLVGRWIQSFYGAPDGLMLQKDDTKNFLISRLGLSGSLPVTIDEVSNIAKEDLSELAYRVTQGRDRGRLSRNGSERGNLNTWNTIAVVSSNHSLLDKLAANKGDSSAELNRVIEIPVNTCFTFCRNTATDVYRTITKNYGHGGAKYIQYLVDHQDKHQEKIDVVVKMLEDRLGAAHGERFWLAVAGATIYGASIAHSLGLISAKPAPLLDFVVDALKNAKATKKDLTTTSAIDILGAFLSKYNQHGVIVGTNSSTQAARDSRGAVLYRYEMDSGKLFISVPDFRAYLSEHSYSSHKVKYDLMAQGVLATDKARVNLVKGLAGQVGAVVQCWEIKAHAPVLGNVTMALVRDEVVTPTAVAGLG